MWDFALKKLNNEIDKNIIYYDNMKINDQLNKYNYTDINKYDIHDDNELENKVEQLKKFSCIYNLIDLIKKFPLLNCYISKSENDNQIDDFNNKINTY